MHRLSIHGNYPDQQSAAEYTDTIERVLDALDLVDSPPEEAFDKYTRLVIKFFGVPVALVSFVEEDRDRQYFKSQIGLPGEWAKKRQTPLSHSFCRYVKNKNRPLVIRCAPGDARVCGNPAIQDLGVCAYLGVPVHGPDSQPLGALCAIDSRERSWTNSDLEMMQDIAACVTDQISLRDAVRRAG